MKKLHQFLTASVSLFVFCLAIGAASAQNVSPTFSVKPFTDVPTSHPHYEAIEYLRTHNMLKGEFSDGMYHPNQRLRRDVLVQMFTSEFFMPSRDNACLNSMGTGSLMLFKDIDRKNMYATDICNAKSTDLIRGYPDGFFRPTRAVNFVEAAKIVTRVLRVDVPQGATEDAQWYGVYVQTLSAAHAIPTSITHLGKPLTRGELAEIVYRLKANRMDKPSLGVTDFGL